MPNIVTVTGPVNSGEGGVTLIHEHLLISLRCYWNPESDPSVALESIDRHNLSRVRANPFARMSDLETTLDGTTIRAT
jgi:predicted metal-dependent phosphotriesterase family hydrolase